LILAGDIGGTKTNLGLFTEESDGLRLQRFAAFHSSDFSGLGPVVGRFLGEEGAAGKDLAAACFGIAGPVVDNRVETPNLAWRVDGTALAAEIRLPEERLLLINDLVATAEGIPLLSTAELAVVQSGTAHSQANRVLLAAGTGLGMALLPWAGDHWLPVPSEGGHADFAPRTEEEIGLLVWLRKRLGGHVSLERVLAGPGLVHVYDYLRDEEGLAPAPDVEARLEKEDPAKVISEAGIAEAAPLYTRALAIFAGIYGAAAGNLALVGTAEGGVYLGGGIAPKILPALATAGFREAFAAKGRLRGYLERIPVQVILNDRTALLGAARRAAQLAA
jgi:glucokinase